MRRAFSAVTIVAALALAVSACGGGDGGTAAAPSQAAPADPSKISGEITWWDTVRPDSEGPTFQALIKDFEAKYPNIKVKYVNVPSDQAQNQFQTAAQAGTGAPDVIRSEVAWTSQFASLGYLQPLDGSRAVENESDFLPGPLSSTKYNGKAYAVPQVTDTLALLYNKRLLKEAGHEKAPTTVEELKQVALDVKKKTGVNGLALNVDSYFLLPFMYGEGGDLLDVQNKKITVNSPANVKAMATVADLVTSGAAPKPAIQDSYANAMTALKDGKAAMIYNGPWALAEVYQGKEFKDKENLGIAPVPAGSVKAGAPTGGWNLAIYAGSKNIPAATEFVRFMSTPESQAKVAKEISLLPTRASAYDNPDVQGNKDVAVFKPIMDTATARPWIPEGGQLFQPLLEGYQALVGGKTTPEEMLKTVDEKYRGIFKDWS
ncbi:arabinogalactan oligomer/maltooligosaccharide transport system substrate-binding protein [Streptosporangium becharense]|uniref:Arabinogalactan oligomer/maltooligosaccharide transport system substrate-binding protein n=1 Tax=Streptosporangium becharense TaxID=1816182 RepID=A0A7W9ILK9_9ACTN|nr:extracellular solute-binding protein [Streptosporangium becharense]MBB2910159.1 arabinogalactan oligomer/maltooligosaccharide transport system substrate-binding protein [Streptosporangium becharense]MBB5822902.1 arabinogalactan oligomer/maltooligosaccharide transport system substrate-binding protein [Streptosporangium becharense]